jgi:NAD-dependent DNA ligase
MNNFEIYMDINMRRSINMAVPYYIMAAYAYYKEDDPIISDFTFDKLAEFILENYDKITHPHKKFLDKGTLEAGTYLGEYPRLAIDSLNHLRKYIESPKKNKTKR